MEAPSHPSADDVLRARSLHVSYHGSPALRDVSISVRRGEIVTIGGPRGSGRTTLLRCLSGQHVPTQGEVWFDERPVHDLAAVHRERLRRDHFGWIDPEPRLVPELTAWENVALPLLLRGVPHRTARVTAEEWLERLDIPRSGGKRPHAMLHAERQRVSIARALVTTPTVLFADEPTAPLHAVERAVVLRTLATAARTHGVTVVMTTHGTEAVGLADRAVTLEDGRTVPATTPAPGPSDTEGRATCSLSV